ncbi:MAG TPA: DegT/DnrJ/EryC1/StrS family aminotransferase [Phycisphaerae bacterium]|nr:DegT/DnrJ/EryC1/StrS family aminotransferase [Phycisphaerae bacterium]
MSDEPISLSRPDITDAEIQAVTDVLRTDRLSIGPRLEAFEAACARRAGRKFAVGVNSGTSGLHLIVKSLGLGEGDEVITTPFSFIATTNAVLFERARPVLVDIDPDSYNLDPAAAEAAVTARTKAILPVEIFGNTAHFDEYEALARRAGLAMIEDCCEALGGVLGDRPAGSFGQAGCFAFYPNKQITTGEGGMIVADNERIRDLCASLRNQGRATEAWLSHARLGYNYRMSEIAAAIGEVQMRRLDEILAARRRAAGLYDQALGDLEDVHLPPMAERERASWFVYVIRLADRFDQADRDAIIERLRRRGIGCSNYFVPIHTQPFISEMLGTRPGDFPVTERVAARTIALPFFAGLAAGQVARVCDALAEAMRAVGKA